MVEGGRFKPIERPARHEHEVEAGRKGELVGPEAFAQPTLGAGAGHGVADRGSRRDEAGPGGAHGGGRRGFRGRGGGRRGGVFVRVRRVYARARGGAGGARSVIKHKGAAIEAAPLGADVVEIGRPTQVLVGAKAHGVEAGEPGLARPGA